MRDRTWDVAVVGAGPAGALAAYLLARAGHSVVLLERAAWPRRKVCGCVLNGNARETLNAVGLASILTDAVPSDRFLLAAGGRTASIRLTGNSVLSRTALDERLVATAVTAGVEFRAEMPVRLAPARGDEPVTLDGPLGQSIRATVVIAANGLAGGLTADETVVAAGSRLGAGVAVDASANGYPSGTVAMAVGRDGYVGLTRLEDGRLNVAAALAPSAVTRAGGLGPCAATTIAAAGLPPIPGLADVEWKGTPLLTRRPIRPAGRRVFAVGDAAGYVEPFTGEGIAWALAAARAVVPFVSRAVERWDDRLADEWCAAHRAAVGRRQWLCRLLAWGLRRPGVVAAAAALGHVVPFVFAPAVRLLNRPTPLPI